MPWMVLQLKIMKNIEIRTVSTGTPYGSSSRSIIRKELMKNFTRIIKKLKVNKSPVIIRFVQLMNNPETGRMKIILSKVQLGNNITDLHTQAWSSIKTFLWSTFLIKNLKTKMRLFVRLIMRIRDFKCEQAIWYLRKRDYRFCICFDRLLTALFNAHSKRWE